MKLACFREFFSQTLDGCGTESTLVNIDMLQRRDLSQRIENRIGQSWVLRSAKQTDSFQWQCRDGLQVVGSHLGRNTKKISNRIPIWTGETELPQMLERRERIDVCIRGSMRVVVPRLICFTAISLAVKVFGSTLARANRVLGPPTRSHPEPEASNYETWCHFFLLSTSDLSREQNIQSIQLLPCSVTLGACFE